MRELTDKEFELYFKALREDNARFSSALDALLTRVRLLEKKITYHTNVVGNPHET